MPPTIHKPIYPKAFFESPVPPRNTCFLIMPFAREFAPVDRAIRAAATAAGLEPRRADDLFEGKAVLQKILNGIEEARIVVADVTGRNPNVFWELGVAQVRKDTTVVITQNVDDVPFDLRHFEMRQYMVGPGGLVVLRRQLTEILTQFAPGRLDEAQTETVKVLYWSKSHRAKYGAGLVVENIGDEIALDLEGQRLMPDGKFERSAALKSLRPGEREAIFPGWDPAPLPDDAPGSAAPGQYLTRVIWHDRARNRYVGGWVDTDKRD